MKNTKLNLLFLTLGMLALSSFSVAQDDRSQRPSPPAQVTETVGAAEVTIDYSQPSKNGRDIFGALVPFDKVWRTGANEASWIEVSEDVTINGSPLPAGKYGLFTIPNEDNWVIIFHEKWDQWGSYRYRESGDVLRVTVEPSTVALTERFTIAISDEGVVSLAWDTTKVEFTVSN